METWSLDIVPTLHVKPTHLSFFLSGSTAVTRIFTAATCTATTIIPVEPCALNAEIISAFRTEFQAFHAEI